MATAEHAHYLDLTRQAILRAAWAARDGHDIIARIELASARAHLGVADVFSASLGDHHASATERHLIGVLAETL